MKAETMKITRDLREAIDAFEAARHRLHQADPAAYSDMESVALRLAYRVSVMVERADRKSEQGAQQ